MIGKESEAMVRRQEAGVSVEETEGSAMVINAPLGPNISLELRVPTPERLSVGRLKALHSFALLCKEGRLVRILTGHGGAAGDVARDRTSMIEEGVMHDCGSERRGSGLVEGGVGREVDKTTERISRKKRKK